MKAGDTKETRERGSLTVEALLFLIPFMCAFFTLINAARFVQAEMLLHHAVTQTAKQISTYSYIMTKMDITKQMQETNGKSKKFISDTEETVNSVMDFVGAFGELGSGDDLAAEVQNTVQKAQAAGDAVTEYFSDPKDILNGALAVVKSGGRQIVLTWVVGGITRGCIKESLEKVTDDPDRYLKNIGVIDGMAGLDFSQSEWMTNTPEDGKGNVDIVVTYKLKNLLFPDFDFGEYEFCQCASTCIW
ncbi:MAG: hypothetical protein IKV59_00290 [Lachnospiraceae bacterium]|nr:hypothetical protein [Lachnospiraceae bacterium]